MIFSFQASRSWECRHYAGMAISGRLRRRFSGRHAVSYSGSDRRFHTGAYGSRTATLRDRAKELMEAL